MIRWTIIPAVFLVHALASGAWAVEVEATLVDGGTVAGKWLGSSEQAIELMAGETATSVPLADLTELRFPFQPIAALNDVRFLVSDGGQLSGKVLESGSDTVFVQTSVFEKLELRFERLAGMHWVSDAPAARAKVLFQEALDARLPAEDVLISQSAEGAKALRGRVERLDAGGGNFVLDGRSRRFQAESVFGVVFAAGAREATPAPARVTLADGTVAAGKIERADQQSLWFSGTLGDDIPLPISSIARIAFTSPRLVYLSDLRPVDEVVEGRLHHPWPVRYDRNVSGGAIALDGHEFAKGIGVHSRTALTFDLSRMFERFLATVGIDDCVGPRGSLIFRVHADGKTLFDSGEVRGCDAPRDVAVDVSGVARLTLEVDYGAWWDVSDQADWAAARLVRPAAAKTH